MNHDEPSFKPDPPEPICYGFTAGVIRIAWRGRSRVSLDGRDGMLHPAMITECHAARGALPRDAVNRALHGLIVRAPDGALSRIVGVESFATPNLGASASIGVLLVPVTEP